MEYSNLYDHRFLYRSVLDQTNESTVTQIPQNLNDI